VAYAPPVATFVIVHGGWGGGWEWRSVADALTSRGHTVFTPTLTGLGERSHLLTRSVDLSTHRDDVVAVIRWERLRDVLLVGHSYGGMVISTAASHVRDRLRGMIYVDAFVPKDGQAEHDLIDPEWVAAMILRPAEERGEGWFVPFPFADDLAAYPTDVADRYRVSRHPLATLTEPAVIGDGLSGLPAAFITCTDKEPGTDAFVASREVARERGWLEFDINSGHDVQIEDPEGIARLLHDVAAVL
jgi:pimeloyl-ACP methyl ester carboxylesterase